MAFDMKLTMKSDDTNGVTLGELAEFVRRAQAAGASEHERITVNAFTDVSAYDDVRPEHHYSLLVASISIND
ncbi:hypothetical protein [Kineosporia babensis]|uniref:Uncharacterized protein n=1 Tax=Kineosporia babensis TaxID=499548 RepID=A0A9X1N987_9ACTN|nr:hypothetical protein [Kineosporia babensis]MCD5310877.1 hypothetical protein [Kineosporia babensis]